MLFAGVLLYSEDDCLLVARDTAAAGRGGCSEYECLMSVLEIYVLLQETSESLELGRG